MGNKGGKKEQKAPERPDAVEPKYKETPKESAASTFKESQGVVALIPKREYPRHTNQYDGFPILRQMENKNDSLQAHLIDEAVRAYERANFDPDAQRVAKEGIVKMIEYYNYRGQARPRYGQVVEKMTKLPNFRLYKLVSLVDKIGPEPWDGNNHFNPLKNSVAILELAVDEVAHSSNFDGKFLDANSLRRGEKYCAPSAFVLRAWIISDFKNIQTVEQKVTEGKAKFASIFDSTFEYVLGQQVFVPDFGKPGRGCICGIHGFVTKEDAVKFIRTGFSGIDTSNKLAKTRDLNYSDIVNTIEHTDVEEGSKGRAIYMTEEQLLRGVERAYERQYGDVVIMDNV